MNGLIMKRKTTVFVNLALLALVGSSVVCSKIKSPLAGLSLSGTRKVEVADPQYQMTAYTLEIPGDWKFAGTIARDPGCHAKDRLENRARSAEVPVTTRPPVLSRKTLPSQGA